MKNDMSSKLGIIDKIIRAIQRLGPLGIFVVNMIFVLVLAYICANWEGTSPNIRKFLQISIILLAFISVLLLPFLYLVFKYIDRIINPRIKDKSEK